MARLRATIGSLIAAVAMTFTMPAAPALAGQLPGITPEIDLNGVWELTEHGQRQDNAAPLVRIVHTRDTVAAAFITGAECFDGTVREYLFVGTLKLEPLLNPPWVLSSQHMWVCSNTPSIREKCGGQIPTTYQTTFTGAKATSDSISGSRVAQGYNGCALDNSSNGSAPFTLTRATCAVERQRVAMREQELRRVMTSIRDARGVFVIAIDAARRRYGDTYRGRPIEDLRYPLSVTDLTQTFEFEAFAAAVPDLFASEEWTNARLMASEMGVGDSLPEAARMLEELYRIEATAPDLKRAHRELLDARDALAACTGR